MFFRPPVLFLSGLILTCLLAGCHPKQKGAELGGPSSNTNSFSSAAPATVINVTSNKANGAYARNEIILIHVKFSRPVTVSLSGGSPLLRLETGLIDRYATYTSGSGSSTLIFTYIVQLGDLSLDLEYTSTNSLTLNGAQIQDSEGLVPILTLPPVNSPGSLASNKDLSIDGTEITVRFVRSSTPNGSYGAGQKIKIEVTFSKSVVVEGTPFVLMDNNNGGAAAYYVSGSHSHILIFDYIIEPLDFSLDLDHTSTSSLNTNGGSITGVVGLAANLTMPVPGTSRSLSAAKNIVIDTNLPFITGVSSPTPNGSYTTSDTILVSVTFNEPVLVTNFPRIKLETGTNDQWAIYTSGSGTNTLLFTYTVQSGDMSSDLEYWDQFSLEFNGGTIKDISGNVAGLDLPVPGAAGSLSFNKAIIIDTPAPTVTSVTTSLAAGTYGAGQGVVIKVHFDLEVDVMGTPLLELDMAIVQQAEYKAGSGTSTLTFLYEIQPGDTTSGNVLEYTSAISSLSVNGGSIKDKINFKDADLTLPNPGAAGSLSASSSIIIDHTLLTVASVYHLNGSNWNDYVKKDGLNNYDASDTACEGIEEGYAACIHGGEIRKLVISGTTDCNDVTNYSDSLDAFDWSCADSSGTATLYTSGLKSSKYLSHLINTSSWKSNRVLLTLSGVPTLSPLTAWWSNTVTALPDNSSTSTASITLDDVDDDNTGPDQAYTEGTIFTVSADQETSGYVLGLDKLGIVTFGNVLTYNGNTQTNFDQGTTDGFSQPTAVSVIMGSAGTKHLWIEGNFRSSTVDRGSFMYQVNFSRFQNMNVSKAAIYLGSGLQIRLGQSNIVKDLRAIENYQGLTIAFGNHNLIQNIVAAKNLQSGMRNSGDYNTVDNIKVSGSELHGLWSSTGSNNSYSRLLLSNNSFSGLTSAAGSFNTYTMVTSVQNYLSGMVVGPLNGSVIHQMALVGNTNAGFNNKGMSISSKDATYSQLLVAHNLTGGISFATAERNKFTGNLWYGNNAGGDCLLNPDYTPIDPGLDEGTCVNQALTGSDATHFSAIDLSTSFIGKTDDQTNPQGVTGVEQLTLITDFFNFDNYFKSWGRSSIEAIFANNHGHCQINCQIFDWTLASTDSVLLNRSEDAAGLNEAFANGAICPAQIDGNIYLETKTYSYDATATRLLNGLQGAGLTNTCVSGDDCVQRYLKNAVEILADGIGDDDGLCESGEACLYTPNVGAYQGHGTLGSCTFQDGLIQNVEMFGYLSNGR